MAAMPLAEKGGHIKHLFSVYEPFSFRRTTTETKEISKLYMISMRMKKALQNLASQRKINMRSYLTSIDKTVDDFCDKLTNELKVCHQTCDSNSRFRTITGCCNNLQNPDFGKILHQIYTKLLSKI